MTDPMIKLDHKGESFKCETLLENIKTGHSGFASYHFPSVFSSSEKYETISEYENVKKYRFSSCQDFIAKDKTNWCEYKLDNISPRYVEDDLAEIGEFCSYTKGNWDNSFESQKFETKVGANNLIKLGEIWVLASEVKILNPLKSRSKGSDLFQFCIGYNNLMHCKYQKNKKDSKEEYDRIRDFVFSKKM